MQLVEANRCQRAAYEVFAEVCEILAARLSHVRIEHVGSSAIPGAISKGDIDVCVVVPKEQYADALATIESLGYTIKPDTLRTEQLCMLVSPRTDVDLALQLIERGSEFEFFMAFRDALLADPQLVEEYNQVKRETAYLEAAQYREAKTRFIEKVLRERAPA